MTEVDSYQGNNARCPKCGGAQIDWQGRDPVEGGQWLCRDCEYRWKGPAPKMHQGDIGNEQDAGGMDGGDGD